MKRIQILPEHLANKIAAGEVVQRPESVVKELLENALDAGAQQVHVMIRDGGKELIQVVDDGAGMDEADATLAFLRHATSKIASYEDLEEIRTYGFRGEALASIGAVARVTMKTRRRDEDVGVMVRIDGGGEQRVTREAREPGTTITVQQLFYNVPARRKFLKSTSTEFRHVYDAVQRVALSYPALALRFVSDDETVLDLHPASPEDRLRDVCGERAAEGVLFLEERTGHISLHGYVGRPSFGQKSRANQFLFLNLRYIANRNISHAVFSAYEHLLAHGTYPFFLLFLDLDPHAFDVNVHPSKMEAKFDDEQHVYRFVAAAVRNALASSHSVPALTTSGSEDAMVGLRFTERQHHWPQEQPMAGRAIVDTLTGEIIGGGENILPFTAPPARPVAARVPGVPASMETHGAPAPERGQSLIWQLHNKYILSQVKNGLLVVDQHVAHERILYERALVRFAHAMSSAQQLLFPQTVQLTPGDFALLTELLPHIEQLGFAVKPFGATTIVIDAVPPDVKVGMEGNIIQDLLTAYREFSQHAPLDVRDTLAKSYSCKAAIKAGDRLTEEEMRSLIDQLFATNMPYVCPHGRPIVLKIPIEELDRRFGRT